MRLTPGVLGGFGGNYSGRVFGMQIVGHGIDMIELAALRQLLGLSDDIFLAEVFTPRERAAMPGGRRRLAHIAGQLAAKEAVMKALGIGLGRGARFRDIEISRASMRECAVHLHGAIAHAAAGLGVAAWRLSVSWEKTCVIASALALG